MVAAVALWYAAGASALLTMFLGLALAVCLFWYIVPGHAMIYGPHLFIFGIFAFVDDLIRLFRGRRK